MQKILSKTEPSAVNITFQRFVKKKCPDKDRCLSAYTTFKKNPTNQSLTRWPPRL